MALHMDPKLRSQRNRLTISSSLQGDDELWRYLDAAKFLDFLENETLFFSRADAFSDKFEGAFTPTLKQQIVDSYQKRASDFTYEQFKATLRSHVFISCWHRDHDDSAAMWALYGKSNCAVALTTTVERLSESLIIANVPYDLRIEAVQYIKHWGDPAIDINPYSKVFAYKTKAYEYEKEVRVLIDRSIYEFANEVPEGGMSVKVDARRLVTGLVIAPEAPGWFVQLIDKVAQRYNLPLDVRRSELAADPI